MVAAGQSGPLAAGRPRSGFIGILGGSTVFLVFLGSLFTAFASISLWMWRTFADSQGFADVATDMLQDDAVRQTIAQQIVVSLEQQSTTARVAVTARPVLQEVVAEVVATNAFQGLFHAGVREVHAAVVQGHRARLLVEVNDAAPLVKDSLKVVNPALASIIPDSALNIAVGLSQSWQVDLLLRASDIAGWAALPLAAMAMACFVLAVVRSRDRRRAVEVVGCGLVAAGLLGLAVQAVAAPIVADFGHDDQQRAALRAVFWSFTNLLSIEAKIAVTGGAALALAAATAGGRSIWDQAGEVRNWLSRHLENAVWRGIASLVLIAGAVVVFVWPAASAAVAMRLLAFFAFVTGATGLLDLLGSRQWAAGRSPDVQRAARRVVVSTGALVSVGALLLLFGGLAFARAVRAPQARHASLNTTGCNGFLELCDRRVDQVVFAGTHNSMSASDEPGWLIAHQMGGIGAQLARGVRAFLIDFHYGTRIEDIVRTDFRNESERQLAAADLTPDQKAAVDRALSIAGGTPEGSPEVWLCHNWCELGASPALDTLRVITAFLQENPNEVIIFDIEDHVDVPDALRVLNESGLASRALAWHSGPPLPTLREMIRSHHNVLVTAENEGGATPWYLPAYGGLMQETSHEFATAADFSCAPDRGSASSPLLLLNHWLTNGAPDPEAAAKVNSVGVLEARARDCAKVRGHLVNILAVDFYNQGDLFNVVDDLNGVSHPSGSVIAGGLVGSRPS